MPTREETARALINAVRMVKYEKELDGYMGTSISASWVFDTPDGRKYARVLIGGEYITKMCFLIDTTIPDDETQPVCVAFLKEGYWAITRRRIEGYQ
jgi:hypothetical protein